MLQMLLLFAQADTAQQTARSNDADTNNPKAAKQQDKGRSETATA